jgi:UDP-N-acetylmuramoylalanine--D-glutamate ligase
MLEQVLRPPARAVAAGNVGLPLLEAVLAPSRPTCWRSSCRASSCTGRSRAPLAGRVLNLAPTTSTGTARSRPTPPTRAGLRARARCAVSTPTTRSVRLRRAPRAAAALHARASRAPGSSGVVEDLLVDRAFPDVPGEATELAPRRPAVPAPTTSPTRWPPPRSPGVRACPAEAVAAGLRAWTPDPHRNAVVPTDDGLTWVDDSKATNPHAAAASLAAYPSVVWIAGGLLKGADVEDLVADAAGRLRCGGAARDRPRAVPRGAGPTRPGCPSRGGRPARHWRHARRRLRRP